MNEWSATRVSWLGAFLASVWTLAACQTDEAIQPPSDSPSKPAKSVDPYAQSPSRFGTLSLHAGFTPDPRVVGGISVGQVPASSIHRKCRGWISEVPDYLLDCETAFLQLHVLARSAQDVLLVARTPDGTVLCNDNRSGTRDPMLRAPFRLGVTQIWVGVQEEGVTATYRLGFSELKGNTESIPLPTD